MVDGRDPDVENLAYASSYPRPPVSHTWRPVTVELAREVQFGFCVTTLRAEYNAEPNDDAAKWLRDEERKLRQAILASRVTHKPAKPYANQAEKRALKLERSKKRKQRRRERKDKHRSIDLH
jgi:hypothetical protein